jgi:16S rRNA processing protein RimM
MTRGSRGTRGFSAGPPQTDRVVVARVGRPHGVRGEVVVEVRTDEPQRRLAPGARVGTDPESAGPLTVGRTRPHGGRWLVTFDEVPDRTAADRLRGVLLTVDLPPEERPEDPEEFYDHQLVGLTVGTQDGAEVGAVVRVEHNPAQDLLVVRRADGTDALVPFVAALVPEVDLEAGRVTVADRPGLLDPSRMK